MKYINIITQDIRNNDNTYGSNNNTKYNVNNYDENK